MDQPSVLIISDDAELSRVVTGRWQSERTVPAFTLMSSDVCLGLDPDTFDLAIAGSLRPQALSVVLEAMEAAGKRVVFVCEDMRIVQTVRDRWPGMAVVRQQENWLETLLLVAGEILRRVRAEAEARHFEQANVVLQRQAHLGRYMLDMRHNLNNALTSVLGNSELLLLEPGSLSAGSRSQIETIRNMSLRMHEILQRFSSLEKELTVVDRQVVKESGAKSQFIAASL
ncbi:MAG TPA: histidine kinase dimerization/phospho-acceptor domain-containing protein [Terriglobales bacterium]|jgi:signal transduction histidine kinase|nr:histidine kinase dimerization/phospho-acceptor domain-containing protein [Terriglobales bacterium]